jgi:hypothetical protein
MKRQKPLQSIENITYFLPALRLAISKRALARHARDGNDALKSAMLALVVLIWSC